jgi:glycosyltransferase involved in cell wall biosynthesis
MPEPRGFSFGTWASQLNSAGPGYLYAAQKSMTWPRFKRPQISLVLPVLNGGSFIERAILSILNQQNVRLELIVVDGDSRDETHKILHRYRQDIDKVIIKADRGQSHALNRGFSHATGEWLGWLCADDELAPEALHIALTAARNHPAAELISGSCRRFRPDGSSVIATPARDAAEQLRYRNVLDQPATFWRRSSHLRAGIIDESLHFAMDWEWWCRLISHGAQIHTVDSILANYYFTGKNKTSCNPEGNLHESLEIVRRYGQYNGAVAKIYKYIYERYDLTGCLDDPPSAPVDLLAEWRQFSSNLNGIFGPQLINLYNLGWISRQKRNLNYI